MATTIRFISNTRAQMEGEYDVEFVKELLSYRPPGYKFARAYRLHVWDGWVRLITSTGSFPAGLAWHVKEALEKRGEKVVFIYSDRAMDPGLKVKHTRDIKLHGIEGLYPWQAKSVRLALAAHRGILKIATGGGKTEVMAGLVKCLEQETLPKTLIIVPNRNLLVQTQKRLKERLKARVGNIGYGKWEEDWVTVAIPNSLILPKFKEKFKYLMQQTELIILDECHHSPSTTWAKSLTSCNAYYRFGLSGTPLDRSDGGALKLMGQTGPLLVDIDSTTLVAQGRLAKPTVEFINVKKPKLPEGLDWNTAYTLLVVKNVAFHKLVVARVQKEVNEGKQVLVLVTRLEHGETLSEMMSEDPMIPHFWLQGATDAEDLKEAMEMFKASLIPVLIASTIFGEGTDLPNIDSLLIADGGKSTIRTVQKAGRALRPKKGKPNTATIVDFTHFTNKKLYAHAYARSQVYAREGFKVVNAPKKPKSEKDDE